MEQTTLEVLSGASNSVVAKASSREFPGVLVQGDSLSTLLGLARSILEHTRSGANEELEGEAGELVSLLEAHVTHYERVLADHGIQLPYSGPLTSSAK